MAYFLKNQNEDQNQQSGNQNQMSGGNIYSTSGSEVSSSIPTSNSSSNSSQSNESGNWVNLNKYLDANQNKVGGYVDQLVNPYTSKESGYREGLNIGKTNYSNSIMSDTAYNTDSSKSGAIAKNYLQGSKGVSDDDKNTFYQTILGYQGDDEYQNTGDTYGYTTSKNQADEFSNVGSNIGNSNYQKSLMGNGVSTGGKNLNSFLIGGTQAGRDSVTNYANKFADLAALLDSQTSELNDLRSGIVDTTTRNSELARQEAENARNNALKQIETSKNKALKDNDSITVGVNKSSYTESPNIKLGDEWWSGNMPSADIKVNPRLLNTGKVSSFADREAQEVEQRYQDLLGNTRTADSTLDLNMNTLIDQDLHNRQLEAVNNVLSDVFVKNFIHTAVFGGINGEENIKEAFNKLINSNPKIQKGIADLYYGKIRKEDLKDIIINNIWA